MILAEVISDMNSNYENRKHGGYSQIGNMQKKMLEAFSSLGTENIFASDVYLPAGQRIEPGSLEGLRKVVEMLEKKEMPLDLEKEEPSNRVSEPDYMDGPVNTAPEIDYFKEKKVTPDYEKRKSEPMDDYTTKKEAEDIPVKKRSR